MVLDHANHKQQTLVHLATKLGAISLLEHLLEKGGSIHTVDWLGLTPLHTAVLSANLEAVNVILRYHPNVNALSLEPDKSLVPTSPTGPSMTPLVMAVQKRSVPLVTLLLDANADPNISSARGWTPLHLAVILGFADIVVSILSHPAVSPRPAQDSDEEEEDQLTSFPRLSVNLALPDDDGNTCLHYAVQRLAVGMIQTLLAAGATTTVANRIGQLPIHLFDGNVAVAEALIRGGSPLDHLCHAEIPDQKQTPLLIACNKQDAATSLELVQMLMNAGASVNLFSHNGVSPLHAAVSNVNLEVTNLLLSAGAALDVVENVDGNSPLHIAVQMRSVPLVRILLRSGADVNLRGPKSTHPPCLYLAVAFRHDEIFADLLSLNLDHSQLTWSSPDGLTAFQVASANGDRDIVRAMLEKFPDQAHLLLAACTLAGKTPLLLACESGHLQCVKLLLDASASVAIDTINTPDTLQMAPIHAAAKQGKLEIAKLLIHSGANLNLLGPQAKSPITLAMENSHVGLAELFLLSGKVSLTGASHPEGITPLHVASTLGLLSIVRKMVDLGADVKAVTRGATAHGVTPVLSACLGTRSMEVIKYLCDLGGDINSTAIMDGYTVSPLMVAIVSESMELVNWMIIHGRASVDTLPEDLRLSIESYVDKLSQMSRTRPNSSPPASPPRTATLLPLTRALAAAAKSFSAPDSPLESPPGGLASPPSDGEPSVPAGPTFQQTHRRGPSRTLSVGHVDTNILAELSIDREKAPDKDRSAVETTETATPEPPGSPNPNEAFPGELEFDDVIIHSTDSENETTVDEDEEEDEEADEEDPNEQGVDAGPRNLVYDEE